MKLQFSDIIFFLAIYWGTVLGSSANLSAVELPTAKKIKIPSISSNTSLQNDSLAASGNDSDLTIILRNPNNSAPISIQTDTKDIGVKAPEEKSSTIKEILPSSKHENETNKVITKNVLPPTSPELGKWIIKIGDTNKTCIIAQMIMQLNITYPGYENKTQTINGPGKNATASGSCLNSPESINITWGENHSLQINFGMNNTAKDFYISDMSVRINATILPNFNNENVSFLTYSNNFTKLFDTPLGMSYKCGKIQTLNLTLVSSTNFPAVVTLQDTQFQAYVNDTKTDFGIAQDCDIFDTPDIVPIAVGTALAILVVVVLVAYLVGRRRSQNRGYLSM